MKILLLQLDGKLPNVALMRIAAHHRALGDTIELRRAATVRAVQPDLYDRHDKIYASLIFERTRPVAEALKKQRDDVVVGGTGWDLTTTLEGIGITTTEQDYSIYPRYQASIGFLQRGCRLKCNFCLTPESLVITEHGPKPIAKVVVGDLVLTHQGRYKPVIDVMSRSYEGEVLTLRNGALSELFPTTVTPEHPVWTRHISYRSGGQRLTSFAWKEACSIKEKTMKQSREASAFPRTRDVIMRTTAPNGEWYMSEEFCALLGWYIAEGYVTHGGPKRGYHRTTFCLGHTSTEMAYAEEIKSYAESAGLKAKIYHPSIGIRVYIEGVRFARWLVDQFGTGAATKSVPLWLRQMPSNLLEPFVDAWSKGDGWTHIKKGTRTTKVTTVSPALALGLQEIVLKLGHVSTINKHQQSDVIQGRKVNVLPAYTVIFHMKKGAKKFSVTDDEEFIYRTIRPAVRREYAGLVYNLEVEDDHSYCTPAFALHNCVVPRKEGAIRHEQTVAELWRGDPWPRHLVVLDNDFFGNPAWRDRIAEIQQGGFRINFNQGINARLLDAETAAAIASVPFYDENMKQRRIYTAWDNKKDEKRLFAGLNHLVAAGIRPAQIMVYILVGYWPGETHEDRDERRRKLREFGADPYPMPFVRTPEIVAFQRWVIGHYDKKIPWAKWWGQGKGRPERLGPIRSTQLDLLSESDDGP